MGPVKVKGFVLRVVPVGESDRIIEILTAERGLLTASVSGARRNKSPHLLSTQLFSFAQFELFKTRGNYRVNSSALISPFAELYTDLLRQVCASHLAEVVLDVMRDETAQTAVYELWAFSIYAVCRRPDPLLAVIVAQLKLLMITGFAPFLKACVFCGQKPGSGGWSFSCQAGGLVCDRAQCLNRTGHYTPIPLGVVQSLRYIDKATPGKLFSFALSTEQQPILIALAQEYLSYQMEKPYNKLKMIEQLNNPSFNLNP